jgi:hypothetical protein
MHSPALIRSDKNGDVKIAALANLFSLSRRVPRFSHSRMAQQSEDWIAYHCH